MKQSQLPARLVIVPLDGTTASLGALEYGLSVAESGSARLRLLCLGSVVPGPAEALPDPLRESLEASGVETEWVLDTDDDIVGSLVRCVAGADCSLVVASLHSLCREDEDTSRRLWAPELRGVSIVLLGAREVGANGRHEMRVRRIMSQQVHSVRPDASYGEIARQMAVLGVEYLPVVAEDRRLVGTVTLDNLLARVRHWGLPQGEYVQRATRGADEVLAYLEDRRKAEAQVARDLMDTRICQVTPDSSVAEAAFLMSEHHVCWLPVVEDDRLVGTISAHDLIAFVLRRDAGGQVDEVEGTPTRAERLTSRTSG